MFSRLAQRSHTALGPCFLPQRRHAAGIALLHLHRESIEELSALEAGDKPAYYKAVVQPIRRTYAWGVPTHEALECIAHHSPRGVVEIGAGTGYWASLIDQCGVDMLAYDERPMVDRNAPLHDGFHRDSPMNGYHALPAVGNALPFFHVLPGGADVASTHPERSLLLCWPPRESDDERGLTREQARMAVDALRSYTGSTVLYVGCGGSPPHPASNDAADAAGGGNAGSEVVGAAGSEVGAGAAAGASDRADTAGPRFLDLLHSDFECVEEVALPRWPLLTDSLTVWRRRNAGGASAGIKPGSALAGAERRASRADVAESISAEECTVLVEEGAASTSAEEGLEAQLDRFTREQTLASLRAPFDQYWMRSLFARCLRRRISGSATVLSDAEARMLERCLQRAPSSWARWLARTTTGYTPRGT